MPEILDKCVSTLVGKGVPESNAFPICRAQIKLKKELTDKDFDEMADKFKSAPETFSIPGVEIFAAGIWNGDKFTNADLDKIVNSFNKTKGLLKPLVKIGHGDEQSLLKRDELPAAGFVDNVRRVGSKLVADFVRVPKKIYELIKRKAFSRISSELFVNLKAGGQTHPLALKAVAILGGETPAVHNLDDIMGLFALDQEMVHSFDENNKTKEYEIELSYFKENNGGAGMSEELLRKIGKLEGEVKKYQEEAAEANDEAQKAKEDAEKSDKEKSEAEGKATEAEKKAEDAEKKLSQIQKEKVESEIDSEIKAYVNDSKITPYQGELLKTLLKSVDQKADTKEFSIKVGKEEKKFNDVRELVKEFVTADVKLNEEGITNQGEPNNQDALIRKAEKYAEEHKMSFKEAFIEVSRG